MLANEDKKSPLLCHYQMETPGLSTFKSDSIILHQKIKTICLQTLRHSSTALSKETSQAVRKTAPCDYIYQHM
jgi:hypothetical protein